MPKEPARRGAAAVAATCATLAVGAASAARAQEVVLPLLSAEARLADFGIEATGGVRRGRVSVAWLPDGPALSVVFLRSAAATRPTASSRPGALPVVPDPPSEVGRLPSPEGLWVWNTRELVSDRTARDRFLDFVEAVGFTRVFLQLAPGEGEVASSGFVPFDSAEFGPLVAELASRGTAVYALDGDPAYVLEGNREGVLRTVARVAEHNAAVRPEQRFRGVSYDVEPHLMPGFQGPRRQEILDGYVALVAGLAERAHASGLSAGMDIPFWLDAPDEETGELMEATLGGVRRPVLEHVLAHVDGVQVMAYRTTASGPDGSAAHAAGELEAAQAAGVSVLVGVETEPVADEDLFTFSGGGGTGPPPRASGRWVVIAPSDAGRALVWLVDGPASRDALVAAVAAAGIREDSLRYWSAGRATRVEGDRQSFHQLGAERLRAESTRLAEALAPYPAFGGLAYHHYVSLRELLERR